MKSKIFVPILIGLLLCAKMHAQIPEKKEGIIHLGIWYPLSTNGKLAKEYTNDFSFHLLYGVSKSEKAFILSGLGSSIKEDAAGVQIAGLGNIIGRDAMGLTLAGLVNIMGEAKGVQIAGLNNISQNTMGLQLSGLLNISQDVIGLQVGGLANISQDILGLQFAGLTNIGQNILGFQFAGIANVTQNITGIQISGLANATSETMEGFQFSGLVNTSEIVTGLQIAGLGNISENVHGFQFAGLGNITGNIKGVQIGGLGNISKMVTGFQFGGLFNKAGSVSGVQFAGLLNIADHSDYPIGLLNLIKDGEKSIGVTFDELQNITIGFRSGGKVMYGVLGVGYCLKSSENLMAFEGGFGAHFNIVPKFRINAELTQTQMTQFDDLYFFRSALRILPAFKFTPHFEVFAGPSLNYLNTNDSELYDLFSVWSLWDNVNSSGDKSQLNIGYIAGIQYCF